MKTKLIVTEGQEIPSLAFPEIKLLRTAYRKDHRGWMAPFYSKNGLREVGIDLEVIQENYCWSPKADTIRGFHYQLPPYAQPKLIQVLRGRIFDVNVDLRKGSPTFGQHIKVEVDVDGWSQILVPAGFAHCFCTLTDDCAVIFKLGAQFAPDYARGLAWNDPDLGIDRPMEEARAIVLERDLSRPRFRDLTEFFPYPAV